MCGIAGIVYFDTSRQVNLVDLQNMTDSISYRGPDDQGFYYEGNVGLGFRRLSIIDLNTGHQPFSFKERDLHIVFNGEIYNFQSLRSDLEKKGYIFNSVSDTEVILSLYAEYGTECLGMLRGMFAFAIWDNRKKTLFCARDRFGIKPLYYYCDHNRFIFGSEIKELLFHADLDRTISIRALDSYFTYGYITSDLSIYSQINKLLPAHCLVLKPGESTKVNTRRYWDLPIEPDFSKSENQWIVELEEILSESIKMHMISDVPLGAFLSGGIDSGSVVALMAKNSTRPVKTFSIGFKEKKFSELEYARLVASRYNTEHYEMIIEPESLGLLDRLVGAFDEPFADSSAIPTYYVSKFAREYVTVALSGDGGDELFAGYNSYRKMQRIFKFNINSPLINKYSWGILHKMMPEIVPGKGLTYYLSKNKRNIGAFFSLWTEPERMNLFNRDLRTELNSYRSERIKEHILLNSVSGDFLTKMQELDIRTYMPDDILTKVDRVSMQNSLEVRVPLLDHKFVEHSFRIPSGLKLKGPSQKYIFKKAMRSHLPENILSHHKQGFGIPLKQWFNEDMKKYLHDVFFNKDAHAFEFLEKHYIRKIIQNHNAGTRDFSEKIWSLLFFETWLRNQNALRFRK